MPFFDFSTRQSGLLPVYAWTVPARYTGRGTAWTAPSAAGIISNQDGAARQMESILRPFRRFSGPRRYASSKGQYRISSASKASFVRGVGTENRWFSSIALASA